MGQFLEAFEGIRFAEASEPEAIGDFALFHVEARFFFDESGARELAAPRT